MTTRRTYPLWNGCEWTFEEIIEDLTGLVKHILLLTTPQEQIQDAMQEVWLKLLERLQVNPELLRDAPGLNNPDYTYSQKRTFLAQRLVEAGYRVRARVEAATIDAQNEELRQTDSGEQS